MLVIKKGIKAKQLVNEIIQLYDELYDDPFINQWLMETYSVFCIIKYYGNIPVCISLLHKIDFDPYHIFDTPVLLNYIYTLQEYRKNKYAYNLLRKIIKNNQIIGFCGNDASANLFIKCGFSYHSEKQYMVRFPPLLDTDKYTNLQITQSVNNDEKKNMDLLIEGTIRYQSNIITAKEKYGITFKTKTILTKYFSDDNDVLTLVCYDDENLILGKPRYPDHFTDTEYFVKLVDINNNGFYFISIL